MGTQLSLFALDTEGEEKKLAYKVVISEVSDVNGDGAVDLADVEYLIKNDKNVLSCLRGNGDFRTKECIFAGPFVSDAKRHFSKKKNSGCDRLGKDLVNGTVNQQDFLQKALEWMADHETRQGHCQTIKGYMADHQHDPNANNLWSYFQNVLNWAITNFDMKKFKKIMKGLD